MKVRKYSVCMFFILLLIVSTLSAEEMLIFAVSLIRHGDRSPYARMESRVINYEWPEGIGELTPEGMRQEYQLGKKLRARYVDAYKLLPWRYRANSMYVLSTSVNRTLMSAQSLLAGLYPDGTGPRLSNRAPALPNFHQPIPIFTIPPKVENIINPEQEDPERVQQLIAKYAFTQPEWIKKNKELAADFKRWSRILGVEIKDMNDFLVPGDNVYCMSLHGVPLPRELKKEDLDKMIKVKMNACAIRFVPKELGRHMASGFMKTLSSDMQAVVDGKQKHKYILYSGHDDSILGIMSYLNKPLENNPPYASHIEFELYQDGSNYFVKTFYNWEPVRLTDKNREILSLQEFQSFIRPIF
ncbi:MAG: histidine phosphatase family protein [Candidatus Ozemobacteraceae bacterium]